MMRRGATADKAAWAGRMAVQPLAERGQVQSRWLDSTAGAVLRRCVGAGTARRQVCGKTTLAPEVPSISKLARRMHTSHRTLGRHFVATKLSVPPHRPQFGRLLHLTIHLQNESTAVFCLAARSGYPTASPCLSNQMMRLIGYRQRRCGSSWGWEWVVKAWLRREVWSKEARSASLSGRWRAGTIPTPSLRSGVRLTCCFEKRFWPADRAAAAA